MKALLYLLLFCYSAVLVLLIGRKQCINKKCILLFALGIVSFASVFLVQMPVQNLLRRTQLLSINIVFAAVLYAAVAGFVQEFFKAFPAFYFKDNVFYGTALGAGFGFVEAVFLFSLAPYISFVAILERVFAIMFHVSSTFIVVFFKSRGKFILYYILLSLFHTALDTFAIFYKMHYVSLTFTELIVLLFATILFITALLLSKTVKHTVT